MSATRVFAVVTAVLALLTASVFLIVGPGLGEMYWQEIGGRRVRERLGFNLQYVGTSIPGREHMYVITEVTPGGAFDRAGFRAGDTFLRWIGYETHLDLFYKDLERGLRPGEYEVVNVEHGQVWPRHVRRVRVGPAR